MTKQSLVKVEATPDINATIQLAEAVAKSGYFTDTRSANQALVKILAGREMGFPVIASMTGVHIIEGKPVVGAHLLASMIATSDRHDYEVMELTREVCELKFFVRQKTKDGETRKGTPGWEARPQTIRLTLQEFVDSGAALGKDGRLKANWQRTPDDMLFARAISKGYRRNCPDLSSGCVAYTPDEMEPEPSPVPSPPESATVQAPGEITDAEFTSNGAKVTRCIDDDQIATIADMIRRSGTDQQRFLDHYHAPTLADFPAESLTDALVLLQRKIVAQDAKLAAVRDRIDALSVALKVDNGAMSTRIKKLFSKDELRDLTFEELTDVEKRMADQATKKGLAVTA